MAEKLIEIRKLSKLNQVLACLASLELDARVGFTIS